MKTPTFYLPSEKWNPPYVLEEGEAVHLIRVLHLKPGDIVRLFDGRGTDGLFKVAEIKRSWASLEIISQTKHPPLQNAPWLAVGFNKSLRRSILLEKSVELGAAGIIFYRARRSQSAPPEEPGSSWRSVLISGAKQCGSVWIPELHTLGKGIESLANLSMPFQYKLLLKPQAPRVSLEFFQKIDGNKLIVLGPEGGLTNEEENFLIRTEFTPISLGPSILRLETAAILALGLFGLFSEAAASFSDPE